MKRNRKSIQPNNVRHQRTDNPNNHLDKSFGERMEKAIIPFKDFLEEKYFLGDIQESPCPMCGAEHSVRPYQSISNGEVRGMNCESCGYNRCIKEDLIDVIYGIIAFTNKPTENTAGLAIDLYNLFTQQMKSMKAYFFEETV